jgi:hypothetical protein
MGHGSLLALAAQLQSFRQKSNGGDGVRKSVGATGSLSSLDMIRVGESGGFQ